MTTRYATPEQVRHVVQAAGLAPSVHNTQPWRFVARPERLELLADRSRRLAVLDPDGRQLHLSCGAALLHCRVAARALGLDVAVRLLPDPTRPQLLADLVLTGGTVRSRNAPRTRTRSTTWRTAPRSCVGCTSVRCSRTGYRSTRRGRCPAPP